jgi:hypothetical protein
MWPGFWCGKHQKSRELSNLIFGLRALASTLACYASVTGHIEEAKEHLRRAIDLLVHRQARIAPACKSPKPSLTEFSAVWAYNPEEADEELQIA